LFAHTLAKKLLTIKISTTKVDYSQNFNR